jgi:hypothetical protein
MCTAFLWPGLGICKILPDNDIPTRVLEWNPGNCYLAFISSVEQELRGEEGRKADEEGSYPV